MARKRWNHLPDVPKAVWALAIAVNFVGPISYLALDRLRAPRSSLKIQRL